MKGSARHEEFLHELERLMMADPGEAALRAQAKLEIFDAEGNATEQLRIRRMLIMAKSHLGQFEDALGIAEGALNLPNSVDGPEELARIRLASMQPLAHLGQIEDALNTGELARTELEQIGSFALAGRASLNLGAIQAMTGHHHESLESFDRALTFLEGDLVLTGQIQTNRGSALTALDRFEEAEKAFAIASRLLGNELPWAAAVVEGNLADLAARQGDLHRSLRHFEASRRYLETEEALGDVGRLDAEEANVLSMLGMTSLATELFTRAGNILRKHGTPADLSMAQLGFARALTDAGELDRAEEILQSVASTLNPEESPDQYRQYLSISAHIAIEKEDWKTADQYIAKGLNQVADRKIQQVSWLILQARLNQARGDLEQAGQLLSSALVFASDANVSPLVATIQEHLSGIAREQGNGDLADSYARKAIDGYEAIRGTIQADQMRKVWHQGKLGIYGDFASSLIQRPEPEAQQEVFDIVERIRSRSLLDKLQHGSAAIEPERAITPDEEPLLSELGNHRRWLNWTYSALAMGQELSEEQRAELYEREQSAQRLEARLAALRPEIGLHSPVDLTTVQAQMSEKDIMLSYLIVDDQLTLQVIDHRAVVGVAHLTDAGSLSELVSNMQFQVGRALVSGTSNVSERRASRLKRDMDTTLDHLYEMLVQPVEHLLERKSHCIVIPSGDLHSVPFAALRHEGTYLAERFSFTTAPSVSVLDSMNARDRQDTHLPEHALVVGVSDETAPGMSEEAVLLSEKMSQPTLLLDEQASMHSVTSAMQQAELIHLACHGRFDPEFPTASGLQLADGWLTLDDIRRIPLSKPLIVLSGCETGRARVDHGDDLVGLMTAMISTGAGEVVSSLWKTHDGAALALMQTFYAALETGRTVSEALNISQTTVRESFPHPAMWAPFVSISKMSKGSWA